MILVLAFSRQYNDVSGLYTYKVYGELPDIDPQTCCDVYNDLEYRKQWDGYVKGVFFKILFVSADVDTAMFEFNLDS